MIIANGHYPKSLALERIKPVYKGRGSTLKVSSYRPILVKNTLAKMVDGVLFGNQLNTTIEHNLSSNIFAYRSSYGTEDVVIIIREIIIAEIQKGNKVAVVAWDIKKAFEELPHKLVLDSISRTGASVSSMNVIRSYLAAQASYVQVGEAKSRTISNMSRGLGQGTRLAGPVFNLATMKTTAEGRIEFSTKYSDDDVEIVVARTDHQLRTKLDEVLRDKESRVTHIGLELQTEKTKLWVINSQIDDVSYEGLKITASSNLKHLGVVSQNDLNTLSHLEQTISKLKQAAARIKALGDLPKNTNWQHTTLGPSQQSCTTVTPTSRF